MTMTAGHMSLKLRNSLSEINRLFEQIQSFGESQGMDRRQIFQLNLVVEELFTNIVRYAFKDDRTHWICVAVSHDKDRLTISLEDDGMPFNPVALKPPELKGPVESRQVGGLGVHICKELMQGMQYKRVGGRNILTLTKILNRKGCQDLP